jgi:hypothetical protein
MANKNAFFESVSKIMDSMQERIEFSVLQISSNLPQKSSIFGRLFPPK